MTTLLSEERLVEIEARHNAVTPGPWETDTGGDVFTLDLARMGRCRSRGMGGARMKKTDFWRTNSYKAQAPRCYLCANYGHDQEGERKYCFPSNGGKKPVKPNGICDAYRPGDAAKFKD